MAPTSRELSELIAGVYDAALDTSGQLWPVALERASDAVGARGPAVLTVERRRLDYAGAFLARTDAALAVRYQSYYAHIDPVIEPRLADSAPGTILVSDRILARRQLVRTEFYNDWLRAIGVESGLGLVLHEQGSGRSALYFTRERSAGPFADDDIALLELLVPHLQRAAQISVRLASEVGTNAALANTLDRFRDALLVVNAIGRVMFANRSAEALLASADGLTVARRSDGNAGCVRTATSEATSALRTLISSAAAESVRPRLADATRVLTNGCGGTISLPRPSDKPSLLVLVIPMRRRLTSAAPVFSELAPSWDRGTALLVIVDPARALASWDRVASSYLRLEYGLTDAEAAVALLVGAGGGLDGVARHRGVSLATVRTQIRRVFEKTNVHGQAKLAQLVARLRVSLEVDA